MPKYVTTEAFIEKARKIHGNKYDYSKTIYFDYYSKLCVVCPIHGEFWITPKHHLRGQGCNKCAIGGRLNNEKFIEKARKIHGNKYDYSKVNYITAKTKVRIICPIHGEFWQTPDAHLHGHGCRKCVHNSLNSLCYLTTDTFIEKARAIHGDKYDYSKVEYINSETKVCIICKKCGVEFWQTPYKHLTRKQGCPNCQKSLLELYIEKLLTNNNIEFISQHKFDWLKHKHKLLLDFFLPEYNIAIECQGEQHFEPIEHFGGEKEFKLIQERDKTKKQLCEEHGIKLLYFTDYNDIECSSILFKDSNILLDQIKSTPLI